VLESAYQNGSGVQWLELLLLGPSPSRQQAEERDVEDGDEQRRFPSCASSLFMGRVVSRRRDTTTRVPSLTRTSARTGEVSPTPEDVRWPEAGTVAATERGGGACERGERSKWMEAVDLDLLR
jgi:hypothetical protein